MTATTLDLRLRTHEVLTSLDRGEAVVVTYRGRPRGVLRPFSDVPQKGASVRKHPFFGMSSGDAEPVADVMTRMRGGLRHAL